MRTWFVCLALAVLAGCPGGVPPQRDAMWDGGPEAIDARTTPIADAGPPDATACSAGGVEGSCIDMTTCADEGGTSTARLCPGAANIQCCTH